MWGRAYATPAPKPMTLSDTVSTRRMVEVFRTVPWQARSGAVALRAIQTNCDWIRKNSVTEARGLAVPPYIRGTATTQWRGLRHHESRIGIWCPALVPEAAVASSGHTRTPGSDEDGLHAGNNSNLTRARAGEPLRACWKGGPEPIPQVTPGDGHRSESSYFRSPAFPGRGCIRQGA